MTRNIYKHGNNYEIRKYYNGKIHKFGSYTSLQDARYIRDCLEQINYGFRPDELRNISISNGKYTLRKQIDNEIVYSETFCTLIEAMTVRDELERNDWSIDNI